MSESKQPNQKQVQPEPSSKIEDDHSWEYYVDGRLVKEDDLQTAHSSYYKA